jgi:hypothetical protein
MEIVEVLVLLACALVVGPLVLLRFLPDRRHDMGHDAPK